MLNLTQIGLIIADYLLGEDLSSIKEIEYAETALHELISDECWGYAEENGIEDYIPQY